MLEVKGEIMKIGMNMKKILVCSLILFVCIGYVYAQVESVIINNESGLDITILITYEDDTTETHSLLPGEKKPFYVENKCIYSLSIYTEQWQDVSDIEPDDKLVIPEGWNRCQKWMFTIKKRMDGSVRIASKKAIE
jgi:hypothetical protein